VKAVVPVVGDPHMSVLQADQKLNLSESFALSFFGVDLEMKGK